MIASYQIELIVFSWMRKQSTQHNMSSQNNINKEANLVWAHWNDMLHLYGLTKCHKILFTENKTSESARTDEIALLELVRLSVRCESNTRLLANVNLQF